MKVLGTAGTAEGEEVVKQAGASQVFNHRQDGYVQNILVLSLKVYLTKGIYEYLIAALFTVHILWRSAVSCTNVT